MLKQANLSFSVAAQSFGDDVTSIQFSTQDKNTAKLIFTIKEGKKPLDLTDAEGIVDLVMGDKSIFEDNKATVTAPLDGKLEYTITADQIRHPGRARGELQLISKDGQSIGGFRFNFTIKRALVDEYAGPVKEYYVQDLEAIKAEIRKTADSIKDLDVVRIDTKLNELEEQIGEGVGVDEQARQKIEEVTTHLAEKANVLKPNSVLLYQRALHELSSIPINALNTAKESIKKGTLKVAFWGDSITEGIDLTTPEDSYTKRVENALKEALPNVAVTVGNFSLGSRTINQANDSNYKGLTSEPSNKSLGFYRSWSVPDKSWKDHVKDFAPDLLIIAFGMNDAWVNDPEANEYINLKEIVEYSESWANKPSVIVIPTFLPTKDTSKHNQSQDKTQAIARATRLYGKEKGLFVADANRLYGILRDGTDDVVREAKQEINWKSFSGNEWSGDKNSFSLSNNVLSPVPGATNKMIARERTFYNGYIEVDVKPLSDGIGGSAWIHYRESTAFGKMTVLLYGGNQAGKVEVYTSDSQTPIAVADVNVPLNAYTNLRIEADGQNHKIYVNKVLRITAKTYKKLHNGKIKIGSSSGTVPTFANLKLGYFDSVYGTPVFDELALLGEYDSTESGNAINHPTGMGHALFYYSAFNGVIQELTRISTNAKQELLLPRRIDKTQWLVPDTSWPVTTNAGGKLYYRIFPDKYDKQKGMALRRLDTGAYYSLSTTALNKETIANLELGKYAYFRMDNSDMLFISVSNNASVTWDMDLYKFEPTP